MQAKAPWPCLDAVALHTLAASSADPDTVVQDMAAQEKVGQDKADQGRVGDSLGAHSLADNPGAHNLAASWAGCSAPASACNPAEEPCPADNPAVRNLAADWDTLAEHLERVDQREAQDSRSGLGSYTDFRLKMNRIRSLQRMKGQMSSTL